MEQGRSEKESGLTPIPPPDDFPVDWKDPEDQRLFWSQGRMHHPDQLMPLEEAYLKEFIEYGFNAAADELGSMMRAKNLIINTYSYSSRVPVKLSEDEKQEQIRIGEEKMKFATQNLGSIWNNEFLPQIKNFIEQWKSVDWKKCTMSELIKELEDTFVKTRKLGEIHFLVTGPMNEARSRYQDLYEDLFGKGDTGVFRLLQGFNNKSVEANRELWRLSRAVLSSPQIHTIVEKKPLPQVIPELETFPEGRSFLSDFRNFLESYGRRSDRFSIHEPSWIEDPTGLIKKIRQYLIGPDQDRHNLTGLAKQRDELLTEKRRTLEGYPSEVVDRFESLLKNAQIANSLSEDHAFWIDNVIIYYLREIFLQFGQRFFRNGVISEWNDVWYLKLDELFETANKLPLLDRRRLVVERKAILEQFRSVSPPLSLGSRRPPPRPDSRSPQGFSKFMGKNTIRAASMTLEDPNAIPGQAASPGIVRGRACVCHSVSEASKLKSGDVLVAETTLPTWTHLFAIAAAVVTDVGGTLSHCATVAREYGIPAVVDTGLATSTIKDGQLLEVDGNSGIVKILPSP